ncbi:YbjC family protein [Yersinia aleksiciae]|uniref:Membrane protein n=1 Tax=Yersinia aleksiciae TaxID=263819 RepID=A0A0T9UKH2_YERAE|nr:YbjC family protein [Yersinia aleksiciae]AKP34962.1 membrane protein [Yersinia aleksiciae]MDA5496541.1 YbjC family protein [Yersinia aleksiciae]MDN0121971.1 YbjC family protein [Yersinia aleksiciae]NIK97702.1 YbjC family protein [Yersinia aleksiciae]WQC69462.1 YbjC family protein [Yersinia aleksiciae]
MRSLGDMPRIVIISEVLGMLLLVVAYLSINDFLSLPGTMGTPAVAIIMIFVGIGLMIPAAACIVWRVASGFGPLLGSADRISRPQTKKELDKAESEKENKSE